MNLEQAKAEGEEAERQLKEAVRLMETGEHWRAIKDALDALHAGDDHLKILLFCVCLTSGLREKLHFWAVGRSQMGKSRLETVMAELFQDVEVYDSQSPLFLIYQVRASGSEYLRGKVVVVEEVLDNPAVWGLVKRLTSADKDHVRHGTVVKGRPVELEIDGLPVVLSNSVETSIDEQVNNRFIIGNVDESSKQDERVRAFQVEEASGLALVERERRLELARTIVGQILLERDVEVLVPPARFCDFPMTSERVNRQKFLRLVKAVTYANRYMRRKVGDVYVATEDDLRFAYGLWLGVQSYQQTQLDETGVRILREVPSDAYEPLTTVLERLEDKNINPSTARKRLKKLYEQNLVDERKTREVDYDEGGFQKVVPGWSLEYKRTVGDLDWFRAFPRGLEGGVEMPSPLQGEKSERARYYETWAVSLLDRGDFHISTISTDHYIGGAEEWALELAGYILGETGAENSRPGRVRGQTTPVGEANGDGLKSPSAHDHSNLGGLGGENRNPESGNSDSQDRQDRHSGDDLHD